MPSRCCTITAASDPGHPLDSCARRELGPAGGAELPRKRLIDQRRELEDSPRLLAVGAFLRAEQKSDREGLAPKDAPLENGDERRKFPVKTRRLGTLFARIQFLVVNIY